MQKDGIFGKFIAETTSIDYKVTLEETKPKSWLKSVCAFANGTGGMLAFGIDDKGHLVGLDDPQHVAEKASELINARIDLPHHFAWKPWRRMTVVSCSCA